MTLQQRKLRAMRAAQSNWGAFCLLTPSTRPSITYWADCIRRNLFRINKANEAVKREMRAIRLERT